jgi:hypothetical protein
METKQSNADSFDENQSIHLIREMIQVSQRKLRNDGILFILWGWIMFFNYLTMFLLRKIVIPFLWNKILNYLVSAIIAAGLIFTVYYIYRQRKKVQTYIGISLRYVWVSVFVCMVLINLIQFNVLNKIYFELQHPIFMVIIAFAVVVTGGILRYKMIIIGGLVYGLLAYISSYVELPTQLLIDAIAWMIAFSVPGHLLYAKRNS